MSVRKTGWFFRIVLSLLAGFTLLALLVASLNRPPRHDPELIARIPQKEDWVDYGTILTSGEPGSWNFYLYGAFAATALKKDGLYYLYYQGASGYRKADETVTGRAIGVATSPDGINFTEYANNPILTWSPRGNGEEGAVSSGAVLFEDQVYLVYGANTEESELKINADARLATSVDGLLFSDQGVVLDHQDGSLWGSGDELFPIITFFEQDRWFVYYLPNGVVQRRRLGVAWGDDLSRLSSSAGAREGITPLSAWGTGGYVHLAPGVVALFLNDVGAARTEVRTVSLDAPHMLSAPVAIYEFDDYRQSTVFLDEETRTWFMYYRNADQTRYGVKLAPAGPPDRSPPTAPAGLRVVETGEQLDLSWEPAVDGETGVAQYHVYRDGEPWIVVKGTAFQVAAAELAGAEVTVTAENYHGAEGPPSPPQTIDP